MNNQWIRKAELMIFSGEKGLDLSQFRITFQIRNADVESPNSAVIRVYNMSKETVQKITSKGEYGDVILNAGYEGGNFGAIFKGTIKQFRFGRESATDTYLDILAADGDIGYNQGVVNATLAKGSTIEDSIKAAASAMPGVNPNVSVLQVDKQHLVNINPRGQVAFGMARAFLRNSASSLDATWSIQNGKIVMIDKAGYLPGEAVKINIGTGLVGMPEQTDEGIKLQCLLNSRIRIGGLVQLNNDEIIQLMQQSPDAAPIPFNQWAGIQYNALLSKDGVYRAYVVEHEGDTRGHNWYTNIICLAVDLSAAADKAVKAQ